MRLYSTITREQVLLKCLLERFKAYKVQLEIPYVNDLDSSGQSALHMSDEIRSVYDIQMLNLEYRRFSYLENAPYSLHCPNEINLQPYILK